METLLPEASEGSNARTRPNEDARLGGVFRELEATDTAGRQEKDLGLQVPQARAHAGTWAPGGDGGKHWFPSPVYSFLFLAQAQHVPTLGPVSLDPTTSISISST